ncbi:MAG TPA: nicotinate-nucleotide adenylyltransferase [Dehalococcoidales bacterium]|nr:MAG: nicotinate (nicotinamide) nucleotide adenylyltransferase [Chloroflexi bacterium RBG_16_60_22]HJX13656.1 nicotinate-nucleotide adenylyltransferase [Dehalococcoidales bacterium]
MVRKIGVLGGTFDPVHRGHILMAGEARARLGLEEVIMVPAGQPMLKPPHAITPAEHRLEMLRLAAAGKPYIKISTAEIERPGPSYTVETVAGLRARYAKDDEIYFILGWDSLAQLPQWREPGRLVGMCRLVAVPRPGYARPEIDALEAGVPGIAGKIVWLEKPQVAVSATDIREKLKKGGPIGRLVPGPVARYIREHRLYTE